MESSNKPLRILQIGMSTNYGGTEAFLMNLYKNIDRNKYQFDFLNVYDEPIACQKEIESLGGHIYNLHLRRREDGLKKYKKGIKDFYNMHTFDIVSQNVQDLINIDMLKYAHRKGVPTIIHSHNSNYGMRNRLLTKLSILKNKLLIRKYVDKFLSCSKTSGLFTYGKRIKPLFVLNGIEVKNFVFKEEVRKKIRNEFNIDKEVNVYCNIARLDYQKNQFFLLDIFYEILKKNSHCCLLICGDGSIMDDLQNYAKKLNIFNKVKFLGRISNVNEIYMASDYFLLPSLFEGFPVSLVEAECSGLPCFISNFVPHDICIDDLVNVIDLRLSSSEWAEVIYNSCLNNERNKFDELCYKLFNVRNTVTKMEETYQSLIIKL